ncbi:MAG: metallophosphoesterase [Victivallales bacterium]|nr:metallophosphoesterase [Victivallales bacterium]
MRNGGIDWHKWTLYQDDALHEESPALLAAENPVPRINGRKLRGMEVDIPGEGVDLNRVLGIEPRIKRPALLVKVVTCAQDQVVKLGLAADWWLECHCNGELVLSTLCGGGNMAPTFKCTDHCAALGLKQGKNIIAVFALSGNHFTVAAGELPASHPEECISRCNLLEAKMPSRLALRQGPYIIPAQTPGQLTVVFLTDGTAGGGIEYRQVGCHAWQRKWDTVGGILRDNAETHRIVLDDLRPGVKYEYRVLIASGNEQWQALDTHAFKAPPCNDRPFAFFVTGDTQFGTCTRGRLLETWRHLLEKAAFHATLGDLSSMHDDYDMMLFGGYFNWLSQEDYHGKPFVAVRGNHELRGRERCRWFELLSPSTERGYYAFTYGNAMLIVLDTGGDPTDMRNNSMTAESMRQYMEQQRQWLEELVASPEYAAAQYRILMMHEAPHSHRLSRMRETVIFIMEPIMKVASNPKLRLHLCMTGHIHRYRRTVPNSTAVYANAPVHANEVSCEKDVADLAHGRDYPFTILTIEGPGERSPLDVSATLVNVSPKHIEVKSYDDKCRCFDHFLIAPDGQVTEKDNSCKRKMLHLYS